MQSLIDILTVFVREFVTLFSEMAPFLLLGFLLAGIIHVWLPNHLYVPKISKSNFSSVLWAALFGVPLPICSCGVIPTSIAIRKEGASRGASVSFLISTPATGVDSILATYSLLGLPFAILRPVAAFVTALLGGMFTNFATRGEPDDVQADASKEAHDHHDHHEHHDHHGHEHDHHDHCEGDHCGCGDHDHCGCSAPDVHQMSFSQKIFETFRYGLVNMVGDVSKWLCIGLLLGALISAFVPNELFLTFREYPILGMLAILLLAMPMYTCATGSIPLALALVAKGITPGAALVLLMAGPATSIASMLVVGKAFGKRTLVAYLISIAVGAMGFGLIVDTFLMDTFLEAMLPNGSAECHGHGALGVFDYICAALLAAFMIYSKFFRKSSHGGCGCHDHECHCHEHEGECSCGLEHEGENHEHEEPAVQEYRVLGMSCSHCKACVEKAVFKLDGVEFVEADVSKKKIRVEGHVDEALLKTTVEEAGFEFGGKL